MTVCFINVVVIKERPIPTAAPHRGIYFAFIVDKNPEIKVTFIILS